MLSALTWGVTAGRSCTGERGGVAAADGLLPVRANSRPRSIPSYRNRAGTGSQSGGAGNGAGEAGSSPGEGGGGSEGDLLDGGAASRRGLVDTTGFVCVMTLGGGGVGIEEWEIGGGVLASCLPCGGGVRANSLPVGILTEAGVGFGSCSLMGAGVGTGEQSAVSLMLTRLPATARTRLRTPSCPILCSNLSISPVTSRGSRLSVTRFSCSQERIHS